MEELGFEIPADDVFLLDGNEDFLNHQDIYVDQLEDDKPLASSSQPEDQSEQEEEIWDTKSIEILLLSYFHLIDIFKGPNHQEAEKKWLTIAEQVSRTTECCKRQFQLLQNTYLEMAREQLLGDAKILNVANIEWPYFDLLFKICQYTGSNAEGRLAHNMEQINLKLLQYYIKHKHLFKAAQFGGEMRLWSIFSNEVQITPEECAYHIRSLRTNYETLKAKCEYFNSNSIMFSSRSYYRLCALAFDPPPQITRETIQSRQQKIVTDKSRRKTKWRHDEIMQLLEFYRKNYDKFKETQYPRKLWTPLTKELNRSVADCSKKYGEFVKKYQQFCEKLVEKPMAKISWRYYPILDEIFGRRETYNEEVISLDGDLKEKTFSNTMKEDVDVPKEEESSSDIEMWVENDAMCIIVLPEESDNQPIEKPPFKHSSYDVYPANVNPTRKTLRWNKRAKSKLLKLYKEYLVANKNKKIDEIEMWNSIGPLLNRSPVQCRRRFNMLKARYFRIRKARTTQNTDWPYFNTINAIMDLKPLIVVDHEKLSEFMNSESGEAAIESMNEEKVSLMLSYYLENIEEFVSPKYYKKFLWTDMGKRIGVGPLRCSKTFVRLYHYHKHLKKKGDLESSPHVSTFATIFDKEAELLQKMKLDPITARGGEEDKVETIGFDVWDQSEIEKLLKWYLSNIDRFKNIKYIQKYIWRETETALGLSPSRCSKKMRDIRSAYRIHLKKMQKTGSSECDWEFFDICSEIYGTDLNDPFLSRTKRMSREFPAIKPQGSLKNALPGMSQYNKRVMSKRNVERLIEYYIDNYASFQCPLGMVRNAWADLSQEIGFSTLACKKKLKLLIRQYKKLCNSDDEESLNEWPYVGLMRKLASVQSLYS